MGFSWVGLIFSAAMLAPSLLLFAFPPVDAAASSSVAVPRLVVVLEAVGRAACLVIPPISASFQHPIDVWFVLAALCFISYLALWGRYLARGRRTALLSRPWAGIPIPLAVFPVLTFAFGAAWGRSSWLAGATLLLALGHVTGSWIRASFGEAEVGDSLPPDAMAPS
jgi:hypothetical protein